MADAVTVRLTGLDGMLAMLQSLPAEVVSKRGGPVKSALRKGALVLLLEAKLNLDHAITTLAGFGFDQELSTGLLQKSLIASRGKPPIGQKGERYLIRIKRKVYQRKGRTVTTSMTANWLERGTEKQPAEPWARPAFNAKASTAITVTEQELIKGVDRIAKKLAKQGRPSRFFGFF